MRPSRDDDRAFERFVARRHRRCATPISAQVPRGGSPRRSAAAHPTWNDNAAGSSSRARPAGRREAPDDSRASIVAVYRLQAGSSTHQSSRFVAGSGASLDRDRSTAAAAPASRLSSRAASTASTAGNRRIRLCPIVAPDAMSRQPPLPAFTCPSHTCTVKRFTRCPRRDRLLQRRRDSNRRAPPRSISNARAGHAIVCRPIRLRPPVQHLPRRERVHPIRARSLGCRLHRVRRAREVRLERRVERARKPFNASASCFVTSAAPIDRQIEQQVAVPSDRRVIDVEQLRHRLDLLVFLRVEHATPGRIDTSHSVGTHCAPPSSPTVSSFGLS